MSKSVCLMVLPLVLLLGCSDDSPTSSDQDEQVFLADTTAHLATDILTFHGGAGWDWGTSIIELPGNGLAVSGSTDSYGSGKNTLYMLKTDSTGRVLWERVFGGSGEDNAERMALAADNNFVVAGVTSSLSDSYDFYLLKVSSSGSLMWQRSFGSAAFDWGTDLAVLSDGYAISGYTLSAADNESGNFMLVRTDLRGNEMWSKTYDRPDREWAHAMTATTDGGFLLAGLVHYEGTNNVDVFVIKTDDTGGVVWEETYGGAGDDKALAAVETGDGGFVLAGTSRSFNSENYQKLYVLKVDASGTVVWEKSFGDGSGLLCRDISENPDGTLILTGITTLENSGTGVAKLDASGNLLWNENIGLVGTGTSIIRDMRGRYAVTGFARDTLALGETDVLLMRLTER
ncbi:MAG: hypothetical protein JSW34_00710 [Candidatus Zixiibacteriota bacterium]|nr:MAG: hypothetical protein JSW34_00710 [candidate division Zixibacteria bacterium]